MRTLICTLLCLYATALSAQQKYLLHPMGWRGNRIELHTISDKAKQQACTFVVKEDSIRALVYDNKVQLAQQFSIPRVSTEEVLGGFIKDGKVFLFLENARWDKLHNWVLDLKTGSVTNRTLPFELKNEKIIDRFSCGDHFLYFTARKKTAEFIIYDFKSDTGYTTLRYTFGEHVWKDITKSDGFLGRGMDVYKIDAEGECMVEAAVTRNKLYVRNDTLYLLMNRLRGITEVYHFDLTNQQVSTRTITHPNITPDATGACSENSYLLGNTLYFVHADANAMHLQVLDFTSGSLIKDHVAEQEGEIGFKNSPVIQEGSATSAGSERELTKTKQLLRKMTNGEALVMATRENASQVQVILGSYTRVKDFGGGGMSAGGMTYIPAGNVARNSWTKSARFRSLLNTQTGEHTPGKPMNTINEKIAYYTGGIKIPPEGENLFVNNGTYYHAYWDTKERRLVILKF